MNIANSIAIIGMAGRFPGANDLDQFWENLINGVEGISRLDDETLRRLEPDFDELNDDPDYVKAAGVLPGVELFDADFFGIKPREARALDPQHRIWFETAWTALENAALAPEKYDGKVGVFCGSYINSYLFYNLSPDREAVEGFVRLQSLDSFLNMISNEKDYLPTRTSYLLNLTGPSINVQTACSTSLVAVAQACQSLLNYESDAALAGGVAIFLPQERGYVHTEGGMLSADGHCRPFSDGASGTVFGSGVGCVVLKRLEDALTEGDNVLAVIRGTALNNDGAHKASYTAPSIQGQSDVIALAQALAGVEPDDFSYIEAHGTATPLGDPIEVAGLTKAFRRQTERNQFVALGATKSSIGHLDAASGVAGLIKTVLSLQHEKLPPVLHFERENPEIEFATTPFYVVDKLMDWQRNEKPRIAGVSSFGVGGTNAHVIVQEAPLPEPTSQSRPCQLLTLSAKTESALSTMCKGLAAWLEKHPERDLADVAWTLRFGRNDHPIRTSIVAATHAEAIEKLRGKVAIGTLQGERPVTFLFPGQGSQFPEMGLELYQTEPIFKETVDHCSAILEPLLGESLIEILYPTDSATTVENTVSAAEKLKNTGIAQPAIFVIEYALAKLWMSWGIVPDRMIGHSVGEFAAACLAGVFSLEDALLVLAKRAQLMRDLPGGAMRAVRMSKESVAPYLTDGVALAAANAPDISIVSGSYAAIEQFDARLEAEDIEPIKLHTSHAFHSEMMQPILEPFGAVVASVAMHAPTIELISTVTGRPLSAEEATSPAYWTRQLRQPVLFSDAITHAMREPNQLFLEIGPSKNLSTAAQRHAKREQNHVLIDSLGHAKKAHPALEAMLEAVGKLWQTGSTFNWEAFYANETRQKLALPTYPFERKRYWVDPPQAVNSQSNGSQQHGHHAPSDLPTFNVVQNDLQPATCNLQPSAAQEQIMSNRRNKIFENVTEILYELSGIDLVSADGDTSFIELGFDSLTLTQVSTLLKKTFKVNVKFRRLLEDVDTPNALTTLLEEKLPAEQFADEPVVTQQVAVGSQQKMAAPQPMVATAAENGHGASSNGYHPPQPQMTHQPMQMPQMPMPQQPMQMPMQGNNNQMMLQMMMQQQMMLMQMMMQQQQPVAFQQPVPTEQAQVASPEVQVANPQNASVSKPTAKVAAPKSKLPKAPNYTATQNVSNKRFGPYKEVKKGKDGDLTPLQQAHLDDLTQRLTKKTPTSKTHAQQYRDVQADPRTIAAFRQTWKELVYQIVTERSKGAYVWDVDGNKYVDITMGFGVSFLGHSPDFVTDAVREQLDKGIEIGPQSKTAGEVSRMLQELVNVERVSFCNTGSEAIMAAIRMARTATGREKIVYFSGDYHGTFDEVLARPQVMRGELATLPAAPGITKDAVKNSYILEYGDPASLDFIREHKDELAAVLVETVQSRHPNNRPKLFIQELRKITSEAECALIFDEVITGFRVHPRGMQEIYGVQPDLLCYGKIIGGGIPIGAVAGKAKFMDGIDGGFWQYGDESVPEAPLTFFAGTFVRHPMAMAAAKAVLTYIKQQGSGLQQRVNDKMTAFANEMNGFFKQRAVPIEINHYSSWFRFEVASDIQFYDLLFYHLLEKGVYVFTFHQNCFFSIEHTDADIAFIKNAIKQSVIELQAAGFLPAPPPDVREPMPLTEAQQEIWLAAQMDEKASLPYNESFSLRLRGSLHPALLRQSAQAVIQRHSALHHRFSPAGEWQRLSADPDGQTGHAHISIPFVDLTDMGSPEAELDHLMTKTLGTPFDLVHGPLVRATLYKISETEHVFHWTAHHIVYDGWSAVIIIDEIRDSYNALVEGVPVEWEPADRYRDYVKWESAEKSTEAVSYWREQFAEQPPVLDLPTDRPRPSKKTYNGTSFHFEFDADVIEAVRATAKRQKSSLFILLLTAYNVLLHRLTNQSDIVVGIPLAGQALAGMDNLVGHCVNIVPLRSRFASDTPFNTLLSDVRNSFLDAQEHQPVTFGTLVRELNIPRDPSRSPLVETVFNLDRKLPPKPLVGLETEIREVPKQAINWEMFLNLYEEGTTLKADFDYNSDLYDEETIAQWLEHFETLLREIASVPERAVGDFNVLSNRQQAQIAKWNDTAFDSDPTALVHELIAEQARRTPNATAWVFETDKLSYRTLDRCANMLAHYLREQGVGRGDRVGLFLERSLDMGIAVLGVLKAGATYVPLAPDYPAERVAFILEDSDAKLLISQEALEEALTPEESGEPEENARNILFIDRDWDVIESCSEEPLTQTVTADDIALIIYTSGSTGRPKGAMLSQRALANFIQWYPRHYGLGEKDGMLLKAPFGFDAASWEILTPLVSGGRVVAAKPGGEKDSVYLTELMKQEKVTNTFLVPTQLRMLMQNRALEKCASTLKVVCVGGETFPEDLRDEFFRMLPNTRLDNIYGPSETTVMVLAWNARDKRAGMATTPIGKPISNMQMQVLNERGVPVPVGVQGELWIGGVQVGSGYWNRPKLTKEKFVQNPSPQAPLPQKAGSKLSYYRTGDYVRWNKWGGIEFIGRIDHQVKLRGLRIELGEIEAGLIAHEAIDQAVVQIREDEELDKRIVAYCVLRKGGNEPSAEELRGFLRRFVPNYMVPSAYVMLPELPTTPNGKINRAVLPVPIVRIGGRKQTNAGAPRDALERQLAELIAEVLKVPAIGIHDDFFDMGGHSLMALRLFQQIEDQFGKKLPLATLFSAPTVAQLAEMLRDEGWEPDWNALVPIRPKGHKTPFFHVGAYMESILAFEALGDHLDPDRPFYGIQPRGLNDEREIQASIEEMATAYIDEIKQIQPHGPYLLGGHCAGAVVAYEMAKQLEAMGEKIELLAIVDSPAPNYEPPSENPITYGAKRMWYYLRDRRLIHALAWQTQIQLESKLLYRFGSKQAQRISKMRQAHAEAYEKYVISNGYHGPMTIFRSEEYLQLYDEGIHAKWGELTTGQVNFEDVTGTHATLLKKPHVEVLGEKLRRNLETTT